jgi:glycosyltransferase involved in cell wall biosynthesis
LLRYLQRDFPPHLICFSNVMIAGCAELLKQHLSARVVVMLQGDDLFLQSLNAPYRDQALAEIRHIDRAVDRYLCHSEFYAERMAGLLGIDRAKIGVVPLGVQVEPQSTFDKNASAAAVAQSRPPTVGYLARLAPEKGLHLVCAAVLALRQQPAMASVRLCVAGWLGAAHRRYAEESLRRLRLGAGGGLDFRGEVTIEQKRQLLAEIDVLCVPSPYPEPKGLYVLEAMAAGVPVVAPAHGAFPELIADTGGGRLFQPNDVAQMAAVLTELLGDPALRRAVGRQGQESVLGRRTAPHYAARVWSEFAAVLANT